MTTHTTTAPRIDGRLFAFVTKYAPCKTCGAMVEHINGAAPTCEPDEESRELAEGVDSVSAREKDRSMGNGTCAEKSAGRDFCSTAMPGEPGRWCCICKAMALTLPERLRP